MFASLYGFAMKWLDNFLADSRLFSGFCQAFVGRLRAPAGLYIQPVFHSRELGGDLAVWVLVI